MPKTLNRPTQNTNDADRERISLTVLPQDSDSDEIRVEVKRHLTDKKRRNQRWFVAFFFMVCFLMLFPIARDAYAYVRMRDEYRQLLQHNQELIDTKKALEEEVELYGSLEMVERMAREELDMVLPGETKVYPAIPTDDIPKREVLRATEVLH